MAHRFRLLLYCYHIHATTSNSCKCTSYTLVIWNYSILLYINFIFYLFARELQEQRLQTSFFSQLILFLLFLFFSTALILFFSSLHISWPFPVKMSPTNFPDTNSKMLRCYYPQATLQSNLKCLMACREDGKKILFHRGQLITSNAWKNIYFLLLLYKKKFHCVYFVIRK